MLEYLHLKNVGPAPELTMELAPRLNVITGDNGLGKSFLLDIAWWALTRRWPGEVNHRITSGMKALPYGRGAATIEFRFTGKKKRDRYTSTFDRMAQAWTGRAGRPSNPGLVLYAQADGGFAVWDPARNYWRKEGNVDVQERQPAYVFAPRDVWDGLRHEQMVLCAGLIFDWALWQREGGEAFEQLCAVLEAMTPDANTPLIPGDLLKIAPDDARHIPSLRMPYGQDVPILHASAAMQRIAALGYWLVWSWQEHLRACKTLDTEPAGQVVFLVDEIEAHLHPRWQRRIVPALLGVVGKLAPQAAVQIMTTTHSPLVLASLEPLFSEADAWFDLDMVTHDAVPEVELTRRPWARRGDASAWLTSEAFDLRSARSVEAEQLLEKAAQVLADESFDHKQAKKLDAELRQVLGDTDPFWMRWRFVGEKQGWLS
jgi:hypothetical protein